MSVSNEGYPRNDVVCTLLYIYVFIYKNQRLYGIYKDEHCSPNYCNFINGNYIEKVRFVFFVNSVTPCFQEGNHKLNMQVVNPSPPPRTNNKQL